MNHDDGNDGLHDDQCEHCLTQREWVRECILNRTEKLDRMASGTTADRQLAFVVMNDTAFVLNCDSLNYAITNLTELHKGMTS